MAKQNLWTRPQLLIALRLYMRTPFGRLYGTNPEIVALAERIGRTSNALAMKACNFANLDPEQQARGLSATSQADRALWQEFTANPEQIAAEAEAAFAALDPAAPAPEPDDPLLQPPTGETETPRLIRARRVQSFFRAAVLTSYGHRCAISGIALPELLVASHIIPWSASVERRADPTNGLCLNALFDRAFDRGLITIDADHRVVVSKRLADGLTDADLSCSLSEVHGEELKLPDRFHPDRDALAYHRTSIFCG